MKNFNDEGRVHYDAETNTAYTDVHLDFVAFDRVQKFDLRIPLRIRRILKLEHYEKALQAGRDAFGQTALRLALNGCEDREALIKRAWSFAHLAILEQLYTDFTLEQAKLGNRVWAVPETMQRIGPKPETDFDGGSDDR